MIRKIGWMAALFFPLLSCSLSQFGWKSEQESKEKKTEKVAYQEDFDPLSLKEEEITIVPPGKNENSGANANYVYIVPKTDKSQGEMAQGFRIQLMATTDENQAREIKKNAMLKLKGKIYLIFEAPHYKVRLGDYATRDEAKKYLEEAVRSGFQDAWIVPSKIFKQTAEEGVE